VKRICLWLVLTLFTGPFAPRAIAQPFTRLILPRPAGGDTDIIFRALAPLLQKPQGQSVVVASITGASGTVGAREAKNTSPDGMTVYGIHDYIYIVHYSGFPDVSYLDFEPVCLVAALTQS
jgi:putative tricarboxylic transport membrane protein